MNTEELLEVPPIPGKTLLDYHRAAMAHCLESLWAYPWNNFDREELEPVVAELCATGDLWEATEALNEIFGACLWEDERYGRELHEAAEDWMREVHYRWEALNRAELAEYKRVQSLKQS